jgi:hypothetical protein
MTQSTSSNEFIRITSNGGYIGGFWWVNSGVCGGYQDIDYWGAVFSVFKNTWNIGWAGELWIVRLVTNSQFIHQG